MFKAWKTDTSKPVHNNHLLNPKKLVIIAKVGIIQISEVLLLN